MSEQNVKDPVEKIKKKAHQAARAESAPDSVQRYHTVLFQVTLFLLTAAFGVLTFLIETTPSFDIDLHITQAVQSINFPYSTLLMTVVSWPGFAPQSIVILALIFLLIYSFGLRWEAVMILIAATLSTALNLLVKSLVQRPRPETGLVEVIMMLNSYSFPSGHVMYYLGFLGFIGFLLFCLLKPTIKRSLLLTIIGSLIVLIGPSRIYLGAHWASDVLGAYLLGSLTLVANIQLYRWGKTRFFVTQPVAAESQQT